MRLRRGPRPGCQAGRRERVVARFGAVRIMSTHVRLLDGGFEIGSEDAYRACRAPAQRPRKITDGGVSSGGGSTNGSRQPTLFRVGGGHIAWVEVGDYGKLPLPPSIGTVDIDGRVRRPVTFAAGYGPEYKGLGTGHTALGHDDRDGHVDRAATRRTNLVLHARAAWRDSPCRKLSTGLATRPCWPTSSIPRTAAMREEEQSSESAAVTR